MKIDEWTGTVQGAPYETDVPLSIGIVDRCVYEEADRDFDGIDGLLIDFTLECCMHWRREHNENE